MTNARMSIRLFSLVSSAVLVLIATSMFTTYRIARPGFDITDRKSSASTQEIVKALETLANYSELIGFDSFAATCLGSAGLILGQEPTKTDQSVATARNYLEKSVALGESLAIETGNFNLALESRFSLGLFLNDIGHKEESINHLRETLKWAKNNSPSSYWIANIERAIRAISKSA